MRIIRERKPDRFTVMDNRVVEDKTQSYRALGLFTYLRSRPVDWEGDSNQLAAGEGREGRDAVRTALRELDAHGLIRYDKQQDSATGRWSTVMVVLDEPTPENPSSGTRRLDNRTSGTRPSADRTSVSQAVLPKTETKDGDQRRKTKQVVLHDVDNSGLSVTAPRDAHARTATFAELAVAIDENFGSSVRTDDLDESRKTAIATLVELHGIPTLVAYALEVSQGFYDPPRSIRAFHRHWLRLPPHCGSCDVSRWFLDTNGTPSTRCGQCHPDAQRPSTLQVVNA